MRAERKSREEEQRGRAERKSREEAEGKGTHGGVPLPRAGA